MDKSNEINKKQESNTSTNNCNEKVNEKKPFLITQDVIDDCLSTSID
ncbi:hypothetical protein G8S49_07200 [Clostridium botulinum C]|uniref:Uncharacterized protein n=2 Tax=Clostridium botulinum TaxID=1491 RepID=A0A9P2LKQ7_CLOBO|nr:MULTISPECIES: hypothetical protein [Clostridium]EES90656.1 conserved hypothetical protein [Clostridium botulinum D str. 1873]MBO3442362.1 hypothetical protein [Clostridium haemolyticum]MCD3195227.1 hypothetical protein [Clostridium botulinum C]MCD3200567.1 hypothetical protein [Clostridium botulinum C]MCD3205985.1 hypothetical protein [Clostridium botulinum C]